MDTAKPFRLPTGMPPSPAAPDPKWLAHARRCCAERHHLDPDDHSFVRGLRDKLTLGGEPSAREKSELLRIHNDLLVAGLRLFAEVRHV